MYDMLRHPAKHTYNVEYIHMALECLSSMVQDEPVTVSQHSIQQMLRIVEDTISLITRPGDGSADLTSLASSTTAAEIPNTMDRSMSHTNFQFPSLNTHPSQSAQQFIHFSGLPVDTEQGNVDNSASLEGTTAAYQNPFPYFQNDVVTTDLFSFFPMDLMSPYNTSSLEGADNHRT